MSTKYEDEYYERGSLVKLMQQLVDESNLTMFDVRGISLEEIFGILTKGQRAIFEEYYLNMMTIDNIAFRRKCDKYDVYMRLKRGRKRILDKITKNELGEHYEKSKE